MEEGAGVNPPQDVSQVVSASEFRYESTVASEYVNHPLIAIAGQPLVQTPVLGGDRQGLQEVSPPQWVIAEPLDDTSRSIVALLERIYVAIPDG